MKRNISLSIVTICFPLISYCQGIRSKDSLSSTQAAKDYFLCKCIFEGFGRDSIFSKDYSLTLYREFLQPVEAFLALDSLAVRVGKNAPVSRYKDTYKKQGIMLNCLEYYKGQQLDSFVRLLSTALLKSK